MDVQVEVLELCGLVAAKRAEQRRWYKQREERASRLPGASPLENRTSEVATCDVVGGEGLVATRTLVGRAQERSKTSVPMACGNVVQDALAGAEGQATIVDCADKLVFRHVVGMFFEKGVLVHLRFETWRRDTGFESSCSELCEIKG